MPTTPNLRVGVALRLLAASDSVHDKTRFSRRNVRRRECLFA